jgi:hypothetical protein
MTAETFTAADHLKAIALAIGEHDFKGAIALVRRLAAFDPDAAQLVLDAFELATALHPNDTPSPTA